MAAPTPVSAYLHAASMVKAGVYLVARLSPGFADDPVWWVPVVVLGLATMAVGGWRAMAQYDLKRLLAFGTVSQLGFLMVLFGAGTRIAAMAGIAMLLAHGFFKAPLFLVTGIVDHATGTRDVRKLSGLWTSLRGSAITAGAAAASMAGLPPLLGFVGKEAGFEAFLAEDDLRGRLVTLALVAGSVFTVAYSARFLWGAFGRKPGVADTPVHRPGPLLSWPAGLCALAGLVLGIANPVVDVDAQSYAAAYPATSPVEASYHLALWHGLGLPLLASAVALVLGYALHRSWSTVGRLAGSVPRALSAQHAYELAVGGTERVATAVTGRLQVGSVPTYLTVILVTVVALPGTAVLVGGSWPDQPVYHAPLQLPLALLVTLAALALVWVRRRFTAVLLVGVVGYGVGGLFIVDGAPDLALAQFLVETLSLVAFVFVLRRMPGRFTLERQRARVQVPKAVIAAVAGGMVAGTAVVLSGARQVPPTTSAEFIRLAPEGAGATNVISAIIVDFRALDTVGEITVLFVAAVGVASLVLATPFDRRRRRRRSGAGSPQHEEEVAGADPAEEPVAVPTGRSAAGSTSPPPGRRAMSPLRSTPDGEGTAPPGPVPTHGPDTTPFESWDRPRTAWLLPGRCRTPRRRTLMLEATSRALFPTILVFSIYLLLVGHYGPGGGFSAGLVAGLAFVLRYLAGGSTDPGAVVTIRPPVLMGVGLTISVLTALAPMLFGAPVLASAKLTVRVPLLGDLGIVTSLFLDVGVYLLIIGVVLDLLRALGSGIERDMRAAGEPI